VLEGVMPGSDNATPAEAQREHGAQLGRSWAATAPLEEKIQFEKMLPSPQVAHDSRCEQMGRALRQAFLDPQSEARWPALYPLLEGRGMTDTTSDTDTWLEGFVDGALDVMGLNPGD
jgi:hypothetical protein